MPASYGTLQVLDTDAANATVVAYGEDRAYEAIQADLDAHNELTMEMLGDLAEISSERLRRFGGAPSGEMEDTDEYGSPDAQKISTGENIGFRLLHTEYGIQFTRNWFMTKTVRELDAQYVGARDADLKRIIKEIRRAIFVPTNNLTYTDRLVDNLVIPLRAFLNADGGSIPNDAFGQTFNGATHTHYLGATTLTEAAALALVETVVEHGHGDAVRLYINRGQEATVRGFGGFYKYVESRVQLGANSDRADGVLDQSNLYNKAIGTFGAAEVWIKPWVPSGYLFAFDAGDTRKPLVFRTRDGGVLSQLTINAEMESHPLRAQIMSRDFGVSPWTRTNGAVLYIGGTTYTMPTL